MKKRTEPTVSSFRPKGSVLAASASWWPLLFARSSSLQLPWICSMELIASKTELGNHQIHNHTQLQHNSWSSSWSALSQPRNPHFLVRFHQETPPPLTHPNASCHHFHHPARYVHRSCLPRSQAVWRGFSFQAVFFELSFLIFFFYTQILLPVCFFQVCSSDFGLCSFPRRFSVSCIETRLRVRTNRLWSHWHSRRNHWTTGSWQHVIIQALVARAGWWELQTGLSWKTSLVLVGLSQRRWESRDLGKRSYWKGIFLFFGTRLVRFPWRKLLEKRFQRRFRFHKW